MKKSLLIAIILATALVTFAAKTSKNKGLTKLSGPITTNNLPSLRDIYVGQQLDVQDTDLVSREVTHTTARTGTANGKGGIVAEPVVYRYVFYAVDKNGNDVALGEIYTSLSQAAVETALKALSDTVTVTKL